MTKRTYTTTSKGRGDAEFGPHSLTYTDTIYADGRIEWSVVGTNDGEHVSQRGVRQAEVSIDWERIHAARLSAGWTLAGES